MNTFKVRRRLAAILLGAVCAGALVLGVSTVSAAPQPVGGSVVATATMDGDVVWV